MLKVNRKGKNHLSAICGNRMELMEFGLLNLWTMETNCKYSAMKKIKLALLFRTT